MNQPDIQQNSEDGFFSDDSLVAAERRKKVKDPASRVAHLESRVLVLLQERAQAAAQHTQLLRAKDAEVQRLQRYISGELQQLRERQMEVEATAPLLKQQQEQAKAALTDLVISAATYHELKLVPAEKRPLADAVKIAVYESLQALRQDSERLRLLEAAARDRALHAEHEMDRLQQANTRMAAQLLEREQDGEATSAALQARCQRLASELEATQLQVQLLSAKGTMYDELQQQCDKLEEDNRQLRVAELAHQQAKEQVSALQQQLAAREQRLEVVQQDKAYLGREVELLAGQLQQQREVQQRLEAKVTKLKATRDELFERVLNTEAAAREEEQKRWQQQLSQLQAASQADVGKARDEAREAHDREVRLLREARDGAQADAGRTQAALRNLRSGHDLLLAQHAELQQRSALQVAQLTGKVRVSEVEAARLQALAEERGAALKEAQQQVAHLQDKVRALTESMYALESEHSRSLASLAAQLDAAAQRQPPQPLKAAPALPAPTLEPSPAAAAAPEAQAGASNEEAGSGRRTGSASPESGLLARARSLRSVQLAQRCTRLEAERLALARERDELQGQLHRAKSEAAVLRSRLAHTAQPQELLLEQLRCSEHRAQELQQQLAASQQRFEALRQDLGQVLRQRGSLEHIKQALGSAVRNRQQQLQPK